MLVVVAVAGAGVTVVVAGAGVGWAFAAGFGIGFGTNLLTAGICFGLSFGINFWTAGISFFDLTFGPLELILDLALNLKNKPPTGVNFAGVNFLTLIDAQGTLPVIPSCGRVGSAPG